MKIRIGFVSNSSSTSFCIYGIRIDEDEQKEIMATHGKGDEAYLCGSIEGLIADLNLGLFTGSADSYGEDICIGQEWSTIKDDETGAQFKEATNRKLELLLKKIVSGVYTIDIGYYNG